MMSDDLMKKRLVDSVDKILKINLKSNGWKYKGKLKNCDDKYIELFDFVSSKIMIVEISNIENLEVEE